MMRSDAPCEHCGSVELPRSELQLQRPRRRGVVLCVMCAAFCVDNSTGWKFVKQVATSLDNVKNAAVMSEIAKAARQLQLSEQGEASNV